MSTAARTDDDIIARITEIQSSGQDFFGAQHTDLLIALSFEQAVPFLSDDAVARGPADWQEKYSKTPEEDIRDYLPFAIGKAQNHRGLSAGRSVDHMHAMVWLMGDEAYNSVDWDDYTQYGLPILKKCAELVGYEWPDDPMLARMAEGLECDPEGCDSGCGS